MSPNLASPLGRKTLEASSAFITSSGEKPAGLHLLAVEVGHDRPDLAAEDHRRHGARDRP